MDVTKNETVVLQGYCNCGMNAEGTRYCAPFAGDEPATSYIDVMRKYLSIEGLTQKCNTARRFEPDCVKLASNTTYDSYMKAVLGYSYFEKLQNNDVCVQETFTNFYWNLNYASEILLLAYMCLFF